MTVALRPFDPGDAAQAARFLRRFEPAYLTTAESLLHRQRSEPERTRRRSWVALEGDEFVGWATAGFRWSGGPADYGRLFVAVRFDHRQRGLGSELWDRAERHLLEHGAGTLATYVHADSDGARFVAARGFRSASAELISAIDPAKAELGQLAAHAEAKAGEGYRLVPLADMAGRERDLFAFYDDAGAWLPGDPRNQVSFDDWRRHTLENPLLAPEGSFVIIRDEQVGALAWLLVDWERRLAENEWTATLPELRQQGLARLAKLAVIRWAAEHGIDAILTGNDRDNIAMLTLNQRLGYRQLYVLDELERTVERR
jgi:GNAT superfamily N-acetyltransferase